MNNDVPLCVYVGANKIILLLLAGFHFLAKNRTGSRKISNGDGKGVLKTGAVSYSLTVLERKKFTQLNDTLFAVVIDVCSLEFCTVDKKERKGFWSSA